MGIDNRDVDKLVKAIAGSSTALRVIEALGRVDLIKGGGGYRGVIRLSCEGNYCKLVKDSCPAYTLASAYVLGLFRGLLKISANLRPTYLLGAEAHGVILDRLAYTVPHGVYENLVYTHNVDTPENRFIKFLLKSVVRCSEWGFRVPPWLINEVNWALRLTWLSRVTDVDVVDLRELTARKPHLSPPYDALLELGGALRRETVGVEYVYRLLEIYVLGIIADSLAEGGEAELNIMGNGLEVSLSSGVKVYYQVSLGGLCGLKEYECWVPDVMVIRDGSVFVIEVKATGYVDYLKDGALQVLNYAGKLQKCPNYINVRPILAYYGVNEEDADRALSTCFGDRVDAIGLKLDSHEFKLREVFRSVTSSCAKSHGFIPPRNSHFNT